jgi:hypothetical protein
MKKLIAVMIAMALLGPGCLGLQVGLSEKGLTVNFSAVTPEAIHKKTGVEVLDD